MCGIAGYFDSGLSPSEGQGLLLRQVERLKRRGPDGEGIYQSSDGLVGLAHTRLALVGPSYGSSPFIDENSGLAVTFNGEIYNYIELREQLRALGQHFSSDTDVEVVLKGYLEWGEAIVPRLNGMFAFALYDPQRRALFCARDRFGQKPFYYTRKNQKFFFASDLDALKLVPDFDAGWKIAALQSYLAFEAIHEDQSIYRGVSKLLPGHTLWISDGAFRTQRFTPPFRPPADLTWDEALHRTETALKAAVERSFRADLPVGMLFSGGVDSSLVLFLLRNLYPQRDFTTFHFHLANEPDYSELQFANEISRIAKITPHIISVDRNELAELALTAPAGWDEPQADAGIIARFAASREIRKSCKAVLTGDGSDEFFFGYSTFKAARLASWYGTVPKAVHERIFHPLLGRFKQTTGYMSASFLAQHFARGVRSPDWLRNFHWTFAFSPDELKDLMPQHPPLQTPLFLKTLYDEPRDASALARMANQYQQTFLPDHILANADRASMGHSVEFRAPFLDNEVTELANSLPDAYRMKSLKTKWILRKLLEKHLPNRLINRPKRGFTMPVQSLLENELATRMRELCSPDVIQRQGLFSPKAVSRFVDSFFQRRESYRKAWVFFSLQSWLQSPR